MENPEYEMADGVEDYPVASELEDAIFTDASHPIGSFETSSPSVHGTLPLQPPSEATPPVPPVPSADPDFTSASAEVQSSHPQDIHDVYPATTDVEEVQALDAGVAESSDYPVDAEPHSVPFYALDGSEQDSRTLPQAVVDSGPAVPRADQKPEPTSPQNGADEPITSILTTAASEPSLPDTEPNNVDEPPDLPQGEDAVPQVPYSEPLPAYEEEKIDQPAHAVQSGEAPDNGETVDEIAGVPQEAEYSQDPHEISDGVYIDPPPAVLLTLTLADHRDVCLFNQPAQTETSTSDGTINSYELLLQEYPTLYYEPLSKVFDAFRNDNFISQLVDLTHAELVLDAYDLQLVVSEDNIFARETSLHDLNVLHDYSDISGPLRLRLQSVTPRFITRYRSLQGQMTRLNIANEDYEEDTNAEDQNHASQHYEENEEYHHGDNPQPEEQQEVPAPATETQTTGESYADAESVEKPQAEGLALQQEHADVVTASEAENPEDNVPEIEGGQPDEAEAAEDEVPNVRETLDSENADTTEVETSEETTFAENQEGDQVEEQPTSDLDQGAGTESFEDPNLSSQDQEGLQDLTEVTESVSGETEVVPPQDSTEPQEETFDESDTLSHEPTSAVDEGSQLNAEDTSKENNFDQEEDFYEEWDENSYDEEVDNTVVEDAQENSTESPTTLSNKSSKRSIQDVEEDADPISPTSSPGSKRIRTE
ncbi:hypothetical protein K435DRAFT_772330 [Dendrothele bispora CBS 962.96]|uniref:Uncharacterized protein n=1 Tax=Dendrothele bispora (strain CBS 962.96) TaxID=1314807 RepID=A0A4V4HIW5_DENBC|nr:hypothetical protein K435DRAFT_772330 [Dendrothele bispora CBS 962.96]